MPGEYLGTSNQRNFASSDNGCWHRKAAHVRRLFQF